MATISQIQNVLANAKHGQYVSLECEGTSTDVKATVVQLGTDKVQAIAVEDWKEGWPEEPAPTEALCFTAEEAGSTVAMQAQGSAPTVKLQTSTDGSSWTPYTVGDTITLQNAGDKVYFKADGSNASMGTSTSNYNQFIMTGKTAASGNVNSLLEEDEAVARTIGLNSSYTYYKLFNGCTSLTAAPALPATTLASSCYTSMFQNCTSLTAAPALPATTLANKCYYSMFKDCSKLSSIEVNHTAWKADATTKWVQGVSSTGTFKCPAALPQTRGSSNIPSDWTIVTK